MMKPTTNLVHVNEKLFVLVGCDVSKERSWKRQSSINKTTFSVIWMENSGCFYSINEQQYKRHLWTNEKVQFDGEINDKELVLELLQFSTLPLLYDWKYTKRYWILPKSCKN